jgi:hypothetical protein
LDNGQINVVSWDSQVGKESLGATRTMLSGI